MSCTISEKKDFEEIKRKLTLAELIFGKIPVLQ